ncbi:MAG TPA: NAD-dependent epimerase/dehydratase family protein [Bacteroidales bacterium]|nr:NAD-dependent epimerase/dehydratase family protein [Bacteroidales bacterium]HRT88969.1 NAD-dependent epimerase/dehydratase family protein [Bacteroidales bacterium]
MRFLVTGATGFIGSNLCNKLLSRGHLVTGLYRNMANLPPVIPEGLKFVKGDILDYASVCEAAGGCDGIFHTAAFTGIGARNHEMIRHVIVDGTLNVIRAALDNGVKKIVVTSTAGVLGPSMESPVNEDTVRTSDFFIPYESAKAEAELKALEFAGKGTEVTIVSPTRVYGPGPLNKANSVTGIMKMYLEGKWRFNIGDGSSAGNYVFVEDVSEGHILAMEKGLNGEKYLLGGENVTYNEFFSLLAELTGKRLRLINIPVTVAMAAARMSMLLSAITGKDPFMTPGHVKRYACNWNISSAKAREALGYRITPLREGMKKTLDWLRTQTI